MLLLRDELELFLNREEWLVRFRQRFIGAGVGETQAQACADAESLEVLSEGFDDDPEGAAEEEMSYWEADGQIDD